MSTVTTRRRLSLIMVNLALVIGIGWIDLVTGVDVALSLVYLIPVAIAGWVAGRLAAVLIGAAAGTAWFVAYAPWAASEVSAPLIVWNTLTRFVIYISLGVLLALLRRDRDSLRRYGDREAALARTDVLTGLPNARGFLELAQKELVQAQTAKGRLCVAYIDLDNFKPFNDQLGHAAGDDVLVEVARTLREGIGPRSVVGRLGGDEFVVLLRDVDIDQAEAIGRRLARRIHQIGAIYDGIEFGATVGIARFNTPPANVTEMLHFADDAMYSGKIAAKGSVTVREL
jgi:diguanylate cyclase (GGDEF)-like protein